MPGAVTQEGTMGKVTASISVSLDGFVAGPGDGPDNPLGDRGERLHQWVYGLAGWRESHGLEGGERNQDSDLVEDAMARAGAFVMGRRMFDNGEEPWGDEPPFHGPVLVLTSSPREPLVKKGGTTFTFVTDGVEGAVAQAREAAGEKDVSVAGGGQMIQQCVRAGLLDELQLHLVPVLLGGGVPLFRDMGEETTEFETARVLDSPGVTHLLLRPAR
ncbi:dihydrofolate reductase family protein [Streptomyces sp. NPDC048639]|uniref:dihydrofolate reductase family protein n=1 Tax=Streptomyces sp. NPDC048639 TaxID=3365581 RepID=UPI003713A5F2